MANCAARHCPNECPASYGETLCEAHVLLRVEPRWSAVLRRWGGEEDSPLSRYIVPIQRVMFPRDTPWGPIAEMASIPLGLEPSLGNQRKKIL